MGSVLNAYFASVFTTENTKHLPIVRDCFQEHNSDKLCSYNITTDTVKSKLCNLKMNKAPGIHSVGTWMLSEEISDFVAVIFHESLRSGEVPQE